MRILVGKTFGIGNSVLSVPMVKALATLGQVDVLIGSTSDDFGATNVFGPLLLNGTIKKIWINQSLDEYDVAVMAIPFDGRWDNGVHYRAKRVLDERKRPGNVERLGFDMWEKHEVEYQMENAYELGYTGGLPTSSFLQPGVSDEDLIYVGIGFKRDHGGFGFSKHFGNEKFVSLMKAVRERRPGTKFISTGGAADIIQVGMPMMKIIGDPDIYRCDTGPGGLGHAFDVVRKCKAYLGNDTGMMHVAASLPITTHGLFLSQDLARKNHPYGPDANHWMISSIDADVDEIADYFVRMVWG